MAASHCKHPTQPDTPPTGQILISSFIPMILCHYQCLMNINPWEWHRVTRDIGLTHNSIKLNLSCSSCSHHPPARFQLIVLNPSLSLFFWHVAYFLLVTFHTYLTYSVTYFTAYFTSIRPSLKSNCFFRFFSLFSTFFYFSSLNK